MANRIRYDEGLLTKLEQYNDGRQAIDMAEIFERGEREILNFLQFERDELTSLHNFYERRLFVS